MKKKLLISFDTDRIKEYVFATGKLKEIRGASAILDELNRRDMVEKCHEFEAEKIYANGGSGMFLVPEASVEAFVQSVEREYRLRTRTGSITSAVTELPSEFTDEDAIQPHLQTLMYRLRLKKDENPFHQSLLTHLFLRSCDSCGEQYASQNVTKPELELICESCKTKRDKNREVQTNIKDFIRGRSEENASHNLWHRLLSSLAKEGYEITGKDRPEVFNDLGKMSKPENYMALIYADGDSMGRELENLQNLDEVKQFSEVVDDAIYQCVQEAVLTYLPPGDNHFPFDILMLGGDDVVMVTTAHKAIEVSMKISKEFSAFTEKNLGERLTLSVGIAIAHTNFPFSSLLNLAEQGLKFAKKEGVKRKRQGQELGREGLINFIVVNNSNSLDFDNYYEETLSDDDENVYRTLRPYNLVDLRYIVETIRCLKKENFPSGKLNRLRDAIFQNRNQSVLEGIMFFSRTKDKKHQQIFRNFLAHFAPGSFFPFFPWFKEGEDYHSPFLDLIELYNFIETKNGVE